MNNINGTYRNPRHDEIADAIRQGLSDPAVAKRIGVARKTVTRVRKIEGLPAFTVARTVAQIFLEDARTEDDGHTYWDGCRDTGGAPQIRFEGRYLRASHVAFETFHGRPPVGYVKADCDVPHCLTPSHILDDLGRRKLYMQLRTLEGLYGHWDACTACGADWDTWGRVQPNLQIYCGACSLRRSRGQAAA
jgi:DNA-binding XRE family transcriptional regulator